MCAPLAAALRFGALVPRARVEYSLPQVVGGVGLIGGRASLSLFSPDGADAVDQAAATVATPRQLGMPRRPEGNAAGKPARGQRPLAIISTHINQPYTQVVSLYTHLSIEFIHPIIYT